MKTLLLTLIVMLTFTGCEEPGETENKHTHLSIQKDDIDVVDYDGLIDSLKERGTYTSLDHKDGEVYVLLWFTQDIAINILLNMKLSCGAEEKTSIYFRGIPDGHLQYGRYLIFTKKELDENNCLQVDGQLEDLTGSLYGYAEYTRNRTVPVKHTVTSNTITYTAQEINEAFALFDE